MKISVGVLLACVAIIAGAQDVVPVPKLTGHVVDLTSTLSAPDSAALEAKLAAFERERGSQVAVLLVPTTRGEAIEDFAGRVTDAWQLGRKGVDDGVLFVIAKQDRHMRIHTGRGVQGALTDALSKRIIADIATPKFRNGDFSGGIDDAVDAIMKAIRGEELPAPAHAQHASAMSIGDFLPFAFFGVIILGGILRAMFGRLFGAGIASGIAGVATWLILGTILGGVAVAAIAFIITLLLGSGVTQGVRSGGLGGWSGGSIGGWSGGGGGGGGFSGGGGGFDGGGASGSW